MSKKIDNNLFKVTKDDELIGYFTSIQRIADFLDIGRTAIEQAIKKRNFWREYTIEIVDGSNILYKYIN